MLTRSYHRQPGQRLFLPSSYSAPGNRYNALLRAALIAARSTDTGIWFPADDLSNCWQDAAGTIPCTAEGQPVGFMADQQYRASGPELVVNGAFATDLSGWAQPASWANASWSSGQAVVSPVSFVGLGQTVATVPGRVYALSLEVTAVSGTTGRAYVGGAANPSATTLVNASSLGVGRHQFQFTATASSHGVGLSSSSGAGTITYDNISVREVLSVPNATALGPELVVNGSGATIDGWTTQGAVTASVVGNRLRTSISGAPSASGGLRQDFQTVANRSYLVRCELDVDTVSTGRAEIIVYGASAFSPEQLKITRTAVGSFVLQGIAVAASSAMRIYLVVAADSASTTVARWSQISVRELPGYHATQPTAGARPTLVRLANGRWGLSSGIGVWMQCANPASGPAASFGCVVSLGSIANQIPIGANGMLAEPSTASFKLRATGAIQGQVGNRSNASEASFYMPGAPRVMFLDARPAPTTFVDGVQVGATPSPGTFTGVLANSVQILRSNAESLSPGSVLGPSFFAPLTYTVDQRITLERFAAAHADAPYLG